MISVTATVDWFTYRDTIVYDAVVVPLLQSSVNPLGQRTRTVYDVAGRGIASVNPLGYRTTNTYDAASNKIAVTDANGNITTSVYDVAGQPIAQQNALGYRTTTVYDVAAQKVALVDAKGNRNTFTYNPVGLKEAELNPLGQITTHSYDVAGREIAKQDARGVIVTYTHDAVDNLIGKQFTNDVPVTMQYDAVGNRTVVQDATGTSKSTYDARDKVQTVTDPAGKVILYSYDALKQREWMVDPDGGRFTYTHNAAGRITSLVNPQSDRTTFSYDAAERETLMERANGTRTSTTYDAANRLTQKYDLRSDDSVISSFDYQYDNTDNRTSVVEANGDRVTWTHDAAYRLTREQRSGTNAYDRQSTFDAEGNRTVWDVDGAVTTSTFDSANQLLTSEDASGVTTYSYDAAGNQRVVETPAGARTTSIWDDENRRVQVLLSTGGIVTGAYRADGLRYSKQDSSGTTKFIWDDNRYLTETNEADETQVVYTNPPVPFGNVVSQYRKSGALWVPSYYHSDALGSTRALTDASEVITDTYDYDAWGEVVTHTGVTDIPFQWIGVVGYYRDIETSTYYVRRRIYSPIEARWLSNDPIRYEGGSWSLYEYVYGQPTRLTDPIGLKPCGVRPGSKMEDAPCTIKEVGDVRTFTETCTIERCKLRYDSSRVGCLRWPWYWDCKDVRIKRTCKQACATNWDFGYDPANEPPYIWSFRNCTSIDV